MAEKNKGKSASQGGGERRHGEPQGQPKETQGKEAGDLKEREYRDEKGEVHHHTRTSKDAHGKKE